MESPLTLTAHGVHLTAPQNVGSTLTSPQYMGSALTSLQHMGSLFSRMWGPL